MIYVVRHGQTDYNVEGKYTSLCKEQNIPVFKHVTFDKEMPEVK